MTAGPYSIGSTGPWAGLSKVMEEAGEVVQVGGKIMGTGGEVEHWDGTNLRDRITDEIADFMAAAGFAIEHWDLDAARVARRVADKRETFERWHRDGDAPPAVIAAADDVTRAHAILDHLSHRERFDDHECGGTCPDIEQVGWANDVLRAERAAPG